MSAATPPLPQELADLISAWTRKIKPLRAPVYPQVLTRNVTESGTELAFLLSTEAEFRDPLVLRYRSDGSRMEISRDLLVVEFGEWRRLPDIHSACAEMDTFLADFEGRHRRT